MIKKYSKPRILIIAMCDNITGEAAGESFDHLYQAGAKNVQIMNTITKKNRPGYLYVIDCDEQSAGSIEDILITEIGTTGWHRINSEHCYTDVEYLKKNITFEYADRKVTMEICCKYSPNVPEPYRIEREYLEKLSDNIKSLLRIKLSKQRLSQLALEAFQNETVDYIDLNKLKIN